MNRGTLPGSGLVAMLVAAFALAAACSSDDGGSPTAEPSATSTGPAETATAETVPMVQIKNARMPLPGVLTGGQPTPEQLEAIAAAGYKTIVNLRPADEEGSWDEAPAAGELGLEYIALPIAGGDDLDVEDARELEELLTNDDLQPMVIHCASGNRVGALFAMHAFHMRRASAEEALQVGRDAGMTRLEETVRGLLVQ